MRRRRRAELVTVKALCDTLRRMRAEASDVVDFDAQLRDDAAYVLIMAAAVFGEVAQ